MRHYDLKQKAFDAFCLEYNNCRPHEGLNYKTPASLYVSSGRTYPSRIPAVEYNERLDIRKVRTSGEIKWKGSRVYISEALVGEPVSFLQIDEHLWEVRFSFHFLGILNERIGKVEPQGLYLNPIV